MGFESILYDNSRVCQEPNSSEIFIIFEISQRSQKPCQNWEATRDSTIWTTHEAIYLGRVCEIKLHFKVSKCE